MVNLCLDTFTVSQCQKTIFYFVLLIHHQQHYIQYLSFISWVRTTSETTCKSCDSCAVFDWDVSKSCTICLNSHFERSGLLSHRCVAKRRCFAPAALYQPFGEQAAGVRSLSQFQALQDGEKELASLRDLGLTDTEIQLWQSREAPETTEKVQTCWRQTSSSTQAFCGFLHPNTWKDVLTVHCPQLPLLWMFGSVMPRSLGPFSYSLFHSQLVSNDHHTVDAQIEVFQMTFLYGEHVWSQIKMEWDTVIIMSTSNFFISEESLNYERYLNLI